MRAFVIGQCFGYAASGYASAHGVEARDLGIARGLAKRGWQIDLAATTTGPTDDGLINRIGWNDLDLNKYQAIVLIEITSWRYAQRYPGVAVQIADHGNVAAILDSVYEDDVSFLRIAGQTSPQLVARHRKSYPQHDVFLCPWAVSDIPEGLPSPWATPTVRAITMTLVRPRYLVALNKLAEDRRFETWVGGLFLAGGRGWGGLTTEERASMCHPRLHFMSDLVPYVSDLRPAGEPISPTHYSHGEPGHGPVRYGDHFPFMIHADVGLNWVEGQSWAAISCKLGDYLGAGLPCVSEAGVPNNGDIVTLNCGEIVPQGDTEVMREAILRQVAIGHDRAAIRQAARAMGTWEDHAAILDGHLRGLL